MRKASDRVYGGLSCGFSLKGSTKPIEHGTLLQSLFCSDRKQSTPAGARVPRPVLCHNQTLPPNPNPLFNGYHEPFPRKVTANCYIHPVSILRMTGTTSPFSNMPKWRVKGSNPVSNYVPVDNTTFYIKPQKNHQIPPPKKTTNHTNKIHVT